MQKLVPVEEAKTLMNEAMDWPAWRWLTEKKRVRAAADRAAVALDELDRKVKASWGGGLAKAYRELRAEAAAGNAAKQKAPGVATEIKLAAKRVKDADDQAADARWDAENTFDEAELRMSAALAREGAKKAIHAWDLRLQAIRKAEAASHK